MNCIRDDLPLDDALAIAGMLVKLQKAVPADEWVDWMARRVDDTPTQWSI